MALPPPRRGRPASVPAWLVLAAIESHWRAYDCGPSWPRLNAFFGLLHGATYTAARLRRFGLLAPHELRLTAAGVRELYRDRRAQGRAA